MNDNHVDVAVVVGKMVEYDGVLVDVDADLLYLVAIIDGVVVVVGIYNHKEPVEEVDKRIYMDTDVVVGFVAEFVVVFLYLIFSHLLQLVLLPFLLLLSQPFRPFFELLQLF